MIRVLVADDHAVVRRGVRQIVNEAPDMIVAGEASTGHQVLQQIETQAAQQDFESGTLRQAAEEAEEDLSEERLADTQVQLDKMSIPDKIRLALRGTRSQRAVLIRDPNRLVCTSVVKSPKLRDSEVELIANMRNVQDEVLRMIGTNRTFLRSYNICHTLVKNPRTPQPIAMNLIGTLTLAFNPGKNNPKVLVPACILLFLGIWVEKGIGLIIPGLVPSPMGEIVDYAPSWVEVSVTLGILALGIFVVSLLLKPALIIEQRYEAEHASPA